MGALRVSWDLLGALKELVVAPEGLYGFLGISWGRIGTKGSRLGFARRFVEARKGLHGPSGGLYKGS